MSDNLKASILVFFLASTATFAQWGLSQKAQSLKKLAEIHQIEVQIPATLDSQALATAALRFIEAYHFGKKPKNIKFNGLNTKKGQIITNKWVSDFMEIPMVKSLPLKNKTTNEYENFQEWKKQFELTKYVLINIASNELFAYQNDSVVLKMKVIVGTKKNQTPIMATYANAIMLYPYWTPTANIVFNEIIPKIIENPTYLSRNNFEVLNRKYQIIDPNTLDWKTFNRSNFPYIIRQGTGCDNSLGLLKINIENPYSIYMHDTPHTTYNKGLFDKEKRFFSHGCIRLDKPLELANWLNPIKMVDEGLMEKCFLNQKPEVILLREKVPVFLMYFTEFIVKNGESHVYKDHYGLDD